MAPEQATGNVRDIDVRTDVHALGAVLYELLTGSGPFAAENEAASLRRVVEDEPLRPSKLRPDVPRDLEAISLKCLNKRPDDRYATANDLARDLERFLAGEPTVARPVTTLERATKWARRRPALAGLSAALAFSLVTSILVVAGLNMRLRSVVETLSGRVYTTEMRAAYDSFDNADLLSTRSLLEGQLPTSRNGLDLRDCSWELLNRQVRVSTAEWRTDAAVFSVAISPDGRRVASGDEQSMLVVRKLETSGIIAEIDTKQVEINTVAFAPDGSEAATAGKDGTARCGAGAQSTGRKLASRCDTPKKFTRSPTPPTVPGWPVVDVTMSCASGVAAKRRHFESMTSPRISNVSPFRPQTAASSRAVRTEVCTATTLAQTNVSGITTSPTRLTSETLCESGTCVFRTTGEP
jgi:WD40 repeat protein